MATKRAADSEISIDVNVTRGRLTLCLLGESPFVCNAMSEKARHELLLPAGRKTSADKQQSLKHNPIQEFINSAYYARDPNSPTLIVMKSTAFKKSAMGAALDIPGARKTQIGRLMYLPSDEINIFGVPELMMAVTRSAGMDRTPDIRTRAIIPAWCAILNVEYAEPLLNPTVIGKLFATAGITQGVGDWRVEKGSGSYGRFSVVSADHPQVKMLMEVGGREAQEAAMKNPVAYDSETENLLAWYDTEITRRGIKLVA